MYVYTFEYINGHTPTAYRPDIYTTVSKVSAVNLFVCWLGGVLDGLEMLWDSATLKAF